MFEAVDLARLQFALTSIYHWLFVPFTIGMTVIVAILEWTYVATGKEVYKKMAKFWGKLFLINFAMGVVTGIVQEFHFGMNWAEYSRFMGDIFGAPLALEALMAFFLESTFMGAWIFGWDRLNKGVHAFVATLVALGTSLSAFWILVANSFMQHPVGYVLRNGRVEMENFFTIIQNGYVPGQFFHIVFNGLLTAGIIIMSISAWHLLRNNATDFYRKSAKWGMVFTLVFGTLGALAGHHQGQYVTKVQPMKMAAMEALWETQDPAPFSLVANIDVKEQKNTGAIEIPGGLSFLTQNSFTSGKVEGIKELQAKSEAQYGPGNYIPDVRAIFWTFRIMVAAGSLMLLVAFVGLILNAKNKLVGNRIFLKIMFWMLPLPFIAHSTGWFVAEAGRQPWLVYGLQLTADGASKAVTAGEILTTIIGFTLMYLLAAIAAIYLAVEHIKKGPEGNPSHDVVEKEEARLWN
ncbi:cytochrome ubiquinol oxidase subunit I [Veillonella denticariosi JCM 15641]|uniref:Cytochrome ubiquinol oxidase subunit I n=1 Tax=Veillonella denticariosi JCM 15641 TaxID=1298594 RepID=A0A2S7Z8H2_9FIRM|nr:cytochrome ubiquinol oxidase subunit I [Veillonella denticariosi]PQL19553.1 cytochrome ubiquinol oxidase subunit I [Veillonella denticariosi JCM 15641]